MRRFIFLFLLFLGSIAGVSASAAEIGRIKIATGEVLLERDGKRVAAAVDTAIRSSDRVVTGANGSVGITFIDNSRVSAGPNSTLVLNRYNFDAVTHSGAFDATLTRGTLAVVSGRIAKQSADAMTVRTPTLILGVRGTEFLVYAD